jgi:hypothetical protein
MKRWTLTHGRQQGQAMVEYTVCALILVLALFTPIPPESKSVADRLVEAVKKNHEAKVHAIGNPVIGSSKGF